MSTDAVSTGRAASYRLGEEHLSLEAVESLSARKGEPLWLLEKRRQGWELFERLPTPNWTRGIRNWWSSNMNEVDFDRLKPYADAVSTGGAASYSQLTQYQLAEQHPTGEGENSGDLSSGKLIQHNSEVVQVELSEEAKTAGVWFGSLDQAVIEKPELVQQYFMTRAVLVGEDRITALHAALWSGGLFLYVPKGVVLSAPFQAFFYADEPGLASFSHTLVVLGKNSSVKLIEEHRSPDSPVHSFDGGVVEILVGEGAKAEYYNPQEWGNGYFNYSVKRAVIGRDGFQRWVVATLGSSSSWVNVESVLEGQGAQAETTGLSFSTGEQHFDVKTKSLHAAPHTSANTLFKAVLDDASLTGFQGGIRVLPAGQQTDSFLEDHTLFLSDASKADALPSLDVDANDVRCSHGATIGMIDAEQIFYLQSRGLDRSEAEKMIVAGFFEDVIQRVPLESVRERLRDSIDAKQGGDGSLRVSGGESLMFNLNEID
ncbi:MAG: Fe-S cluster assembly protein SufD [Chloroflexota bacterium]|nr:Fe-S cluster assembly protein SufD [Chloroflexota bacterium]